MFLTLTITYILTFQVEYFKHLPLDLLSFCRYCMFLDIYLYTVVQRRSKCSVHCAMCMPLCSKFFTEFTDKQIVKIDQYLAKIHYGQSAIAYFFGPFCRTCCFIFVLGVNAQIC